MATVALLLTGFVVATATTLEGGNILVSLLLLVAVGLLLWGLTNPKQHGVILALAVLIIIAMAFAFMFGKLSLVINA